MQKVTKILVPIDFSACSENALEFAIKLADKIKANIQVLNVPSFEIGVSENPSIVTQTVEDQFEQSEKLVRTFIQKVTKRVLASLDGNPRIEKNIEIGKVSAKICEIATRNQIDYIIMGTQGVNSTLDKYLGSTATNVLEYAPCPVFVIPERAKFNAKIILGYASNFMDADPFGIWKIVKLLKPLQPEIKYVHFNKKKVLNFNKIEELESYFSETAPELSIKFFRLPPATDKVNAMNNFIEKSKLNMLAMYKPKRSFFESLFHNSFTKKMTSYIEIPILVLKEEE